MTAATETREHPILFSGPMVRAILDDRKGQTRRVLDKLLGIGAITEFGRSDTPGYDWHFRDKRGCWNDLTHSELLARCPYGVVGDRLWVRERWWLCELPSCGIGSASVVFDDEIRDGMPQPTKERPWQGSAKRFGCFPSIHMPRWASRITLEITEVRVQRLQEISDEDAIAEGIAMFQIGQPIREQVVGNGVQAAALALGLLQQSDSKSRQAMIAGGSADFAGVAGWLYSNRNFPKTMEHRCVFALLWDSLNTKRGFPWESNPWVWAITFRRIGA